MSDVTKSRIDAFRAVREAGATKTKTAPDESDDRRGDLARRRSRDENVGRPRKSKKAGAAPKAPRAPLQSAVFDAWRNAMNAKGIPTVQVPERRDLEDAQRIVEKAGGEAQAIAYAVWTVENWAALTKKFLKLDDYGMTFGTISGGWMRSLFPESCKAIAPKVQGSDFFVKYMGLAAEDRAEMDPTIPANKSQFQGFDELSRAIDAYHDAQHEIFLRKKSKNAN